MSPALLENYCRRGMISGLRSGTVAQDDGRRVQVERDMVQDER